MNQEVLLVDDDKEFLLSLGNLINKLHPEWKLNLADSYQLAKDSLSSNIPDVCVMDLVLCQKEGESSGLRLIKEIKSIAAELKLIVLTGLGGEDSGVKALSYGASNFIRKPPNIKHLIHLIEDGINQARIRKELHQIRAKQELMLAQKLVGDSAQMRSIRSKAVFAASNNLSVLITGPTGCGKGVCAEMIHALSFGTRGSFIRYQPTSVVPEMVISDLFGHAKGSFTGANTSKSGLLEEANGGTLFLDEIDQFPLNIQVMLLGVLQEKKFRPMGSNRVISSDFRLISATNSNLSKAINQSIFREDLYHRIAHLQIDIPALNERKSDIPIIAKKHLIQLNQVSCLGLLSFSKECLLYLSEYNYPGNVRELIAVVETAAHKAAFCGRKIIESEDVEFRAYCNSKQSPLQDRSLSIKSSLTQNFIPGVPFAELLEDYKKNLILEAFNYYEGNLSRAALSLKMDRTSFKRILARANGESKKE